MRGENGTQYPPKSELGCHQDLFFYCPYLAKLWPQYKKVKL